MSTDRLDRIEALLERTIETIELNKMEIVLMSEIEDLSVTVEEYLEGLAAGIDVLQLKRLLSKGIPEDLALEVMEIAPRVSNGTATPEEIVRGIMILTPSLREQLKS